ncbi:MAG: glycoside hydrolase family 5 protein [Lentisphaerales bacterium]|nr:glycoside hydrolase family 5 protein [Lentisphaerales bacterium]
MIFFDKMSKKYGHLPNIIFEIANEPNHTGNKDKVEEKDVSWND